MTAKSPTATPTAPDWISKVYAQICRYYPNDERPAKTKTVSVDGPMLLLALELGIRGWDEKAREPILIKDISAMREAGAFENAWAYADFKIDDEETGTEGACLWGLAGPHAKVQFISPGYKALQERRALDIERNKVRKASKQSKLAPKSISDRTDTL